MNQNPKKDNYSCIFLAGRKFVIGTPEGVTSLAKKGSIDVAGKTVDIPFNEFALNFTLLDKLGLWVSDYSRFPSRRYGQETKPESMTISDYISYLSSFRDDEISQSQRRKYLSNNGLVRILVFDAGLREKLGLMKRRAG